MFVELNFTCFYLNYFKEEKIKREEVCEEDNDRDNETPVLTDSETDEEEEEDDSDDDDNLPDLVSGSEDEGIAECDTLSWRDSLIYIIVNNLQD